MLRRYWMSQKTGKGDALRKEKALLHTFVAGQKYGVGRDATRRCCFLYSKILKMKQKPEPGGRAPRLRLTLLLA